MEGGVKGCLKIPSDKSIKASRLFMVKGETNVKIVQVKTETKKFRSKCGCHLF